MCSARKPKTTIKGKQNNNVTFLSNISIKARKRFAERANEAEDRRDSQTFTTQREITPLKGKVIKKTQSENAFSDGISYWLFHAPVKGIIYWLMIGKRH